MFEEEIKVGSDVIHTLSWKVLMNVKDVLPGVIKKTGFVFLGISVLVEVDFARNL